MQAYFKASVFSSGTSFLALDQVSAKFLLTFNCFKERFEVPGSEAFEVVSLNDLNEDGRSVQDVLFLRLVSVNVEFICFSYLCEELQQVAALIEVDQDI